MSENTTVESTTHTVSDLARSNHQSWLMQVSQIPTAAGKEDRVVAWIDAWLNDRPYLSKHSDPHGNFEIRIVASDETDHPIYFTAHLDHPAFVVEQIEDEQKLILSFRGGVMSDYFPEAMIRVHRSDDQTPQNYAVAKIIEEVGADGQPWSETDAKAFKHYLAICESGHGAEAGDIATWDLPEAEIVDDEFGGIIHTNACDDLAAVAAAMSAIDELALLKESGTEIGDVRVLFTRAEEVGFIGAIGASRDGFMPKGSRIIALENSRAFTDSPIHGGPIVRVGDRISIFSPELTGAVAKVAERIAGGPSAPTASQKMSDLPKWKWQRKLMAGGACEASVYCAYGYCSTCVCLPLGNYHNMAKLSEAQAGTHEGAPRVGREYVGLDDYTGMIDLLIGCGIDLPSSPGFIERVEKLWEKTRFVLG
jgi:putative aminopeptidase FrvX